VCETADRNHVVCANDHTRSVAANSIASRVIYIDFSGGCAVAEVVEISIDDFEIMVVAAGKHAQAHVGGSKVNDDNLSDHVQKKRRWILSWLWAAGLRPSRMIRLSRSMNLRGMKRRYHIDGF